MRRFDVGVGRGGFVGTLNTSGCVAPGQEILFFGGDCNLACQGGHPDASERGGRKYGAARERKEYVGFLVAHTNLVRFLMVWPLKFV